MRNATKSESRTLISGLRPAQWTGARLVINEAGVELPAVEVQDLDDYIPNPKA